MATEPGAESSLGDFYRVLAPLLTCRQEVEVARVESDQTIAAWHRAPAQTLQDQGTASGDGGDGTWQSPQEPMAHSPSDTVGSSARAALPAGAFAWNLSQGCHMDHPRLVIPAWTHSAPQGLKLTLRPH